MQIPRKEAPDNMATFQIALASSNIEREGLGIQHGLEKFHHYSFTHEVGVIADHKPLGAIFKKYFKAYCIASKNTTKDTSTMSEYYTNQCHSFSSQIGYPGTTTKQIETKMLGSHNH